MDPGAVSTVYVSSLLSVSGTNALQSGGILVTPGVYDGFSAGLILVVARTEDGIGVVAVEGSADGLTRQALPTMDQTRKQASLRFAAAPARLLGGPGDGWGAAELVRNSDRLEQLRSDRGPAVPALRQAVELVEDTRVRFKLNVSEELACEALAYRLEHVLAS